MEKQTINPQNLAQPPGYSQVVVVEGGRTVFVAGQVSWDADGELVGRGDFEAQARQAFSNLRVALEAAGATPSDLVKISIFVVGHDADRLRIVRSVRDRILAAEPPPASTLLGVESLALPELLIEVEGIAVINGGAEQRATVPPGAG
jgi:2-iminobutanoate/2-iminopropanoate deaminase